MRMRIIGASKRQSPCEQSLKLFKNLSDKKAKQALLRTQWEVVETRIVNKLMAIFTVVICVLTNGL